MKSLSLDMIHDAANFLRPRVRRTPLEYSDALSDILGVPVFLKLEFLQYTGSFKLRGAWYRLSALSQKEKQRGVVSCSAGNHGKGLAYVAQKMNIKATIYVPKDVDEAKYQGMIAYGAEVICSPFAGFDRTEKLAIEEAKKTGRAFISPFDDVEIMAGNGGTIAMEIQEDRPEARTFIFPVGGAGLAAGLSFYMKETMPDSILIGCQHRDSPALKLSLEKGKAVTMLPEIDSLAGGIIGGIGSHSFEYIRTRIDQVALADEDEIKQGVRWMLEHHQYLIEPSAAVTIAACITGKIEHPTSPTVIILTGRNMSMHTIQSIVCNKIKVRQVKNR